MTPMSSRTRESISTLKENIRARVTLSRNDDGLIL
jgi:hypothetical protein